LPKAAAPTRPPCAAPLVEDAEELVWLTYS
jgi:hypothetical protein